MEYVRYNEAGEIVERFTPLEGFTLEQSLHPSIAKQFVPAPVETTPVDPAPVEVPVEAPAE